MSQETWQVTIEVTGNDALSARLREGQIRVVSDIVNTSNRTSTSTDPRSFTRIVNAAREEGRGD